MNPDGSGSRFAQTAPTVAKSPKGDLKSTAVDFAEVGANSFASLFTKVKLVKIVISYHILNYFFYIKIGMFQKIEI